MKDDLSKAIALAARAHDRQVDKSHRPYILHPVRVMLRVTGYTAQVIAVLHDVIEDTPITLDNLRGLHFPREVIEGVDILTRRDGEKYRDYILRVKTSGNQDAIAVKLADLADNMDPIRGNGIPRAERSSLKERYLEAKDTLLNWRGDE